MKRYTTAMVLLLLMSGSLMAQETRSEKKQMKTEQRQAAYERTKALVISGDFVFEALWAFPQSGTVVNVVGNNNRFEIKDGMTLGSMQYFGTAYTSRQNIMNQNLVMDGAVEDWKIITNDKRQKVLVRFVTTKKREVYDMEVSVAAGGNAVVIVSSSLRDPMRYEGYITPIAAE